MLRIPFADVRFALRLMRRSPGFYALVIVLVAAGIGATTAAFSIVNSMLLRPLPYPDAQALTVVRTTTPVAGVGQTSRLTLPDFLDFAAQAATFERMAAILGASSGIASEGMPPERVVETRVSGEFFSLLGLPPLHGRLLSKSDDRAGGPCVMVVSEAMFRGRFQADPTIIGKAALLNGVSCSIVGVAPKRLALGDLKGHSRSDVWTPLAVTLTDYTRWSASDRSVEGMNHFLNVIGRRRPGISLQSAETELSSIAQRLNQRYPEANGRLKKGVRAYELQDYLVRPARFGAWLLLASVGLVFLVVCANVASLVLARAEGRRSELAVRVALGATPARLAGQILAETIVVFALSSVLGAIASWFLLEGFSRAIVERHVAAVVGLRVDAAALATSTVACVAVGLAFMLGPALTTARVEPHAVLRRSAERASASRAQRNLRSGMVIAQVALALALLVGAGTTLKAFAALASTPLGFEPENLATATVILPEPKYPGGGTPDWPPVESVVQFYEQALARIAAHPGVLRASMNRCLPIRCGSLAVGVEGPRRREIYQPTLGYNVVSPGYFGTLGIPLLRGRDFTRADGRETRPVVILSQTAAARLFPDEDPIGRRLDYGNDTSVVFREVVGIVGDVRAGRLDGSGGVDGYFPFAQMGAESREMTFFVRTDNPDAFLRELPRSIQAIDPNQDVARLATMQDLVSDSIQVERQLAMLLGAFAVSALLLAALGVFGLVSYTTAQRTRELGIRLALGSMPERVVGLVLVGGLRLLGAGLALGVLLAIFVGRALAGRIPNVTGFEPLITLAVAALLGAVGLLGCVIPAWRAARIAPARALRYE